MESLVIRVGEPPYHECSTKGDRRFSPFYARPRSLDGFSIEEAYHAAKVFSDGSTGHTWRNAKERQKSGYTVVNYEECATLYSELWDQYIAENPELIPELIGFSGLSDIFGQPGSVCQALELWRIRNAAISQRDIIENVK